MRRIDWKTILGACVGCASEFPVYVLVNYVPSSLAKCENDIMLILGGTNRG